MTLQIEVGGRILALEIRRTPEGALALVDGRAYPVNVVRAGHAWSVIIGAPEAGRSYEVAIADHDQGDLTVHVDGQAVPVSLVDRRHGARAGRRRGAVGADTKEGPQRVVAPMPGRIVKLLVTAGDVVSARQGLVIVEAMKMENELRSPKAGSVTEVRVAEGALVEANTVLIVVE